jgi:Tol biopolymer transport system component
MTEQKRKTGRRLAMVGSAVAVAASGLVFGSSPVHAAFPGGNGVIACQTSRTGNSEIFTFSGTGTEVQATNITNNPATDSRPRYSPDGRTIVFESNRDGPTELYLMNSDGSNVRRLTFSPAAGHGNGAANFSPGGDQIVYQTTRNAGNSFDVYKIDVDGKNDTPLVTNTVEDSLPAWSPNGDKIAISSRIVDAATDVHLINPDGSGIVDITNSPGEDSWPAWSPDGSMIAFHSRLDDPAGEEIYRINANGSNRVRLTNNTGPAQGSFDIFPFWSPDGTRIGWNSGRAGASDGFGEIYTMSAVDGSNIVRITNNTATDQRCDWQPLCTIYGSGNITGTPGDDIICGSEGPDQINGNGGNDRILGMGGNDQIFGGAGNDKIFGGAGNDSIFGQGGTDILDGGIGADRCLGSITRSCP